MMNFMIIFLAVFLGIIASYAMLLALMLNKKAEKIFTKRMMENSFEVMVELQEDERFEDLF